MDFPDAFISQIRSSLSKSADSFFKSLQSPPVTSIRLNVDKVRFPVAFPERVLWCQQGAYLDSRPVFTLDPLFNVGAYYVQEASSMFLGYAFSLLVDVSSNPIVLDLCAAPGGKSTHLATSLSGHGLLVANEVIGQRVAPLRENLTKWGFGNVVITNSDPSCFGNLRGLFDAICVDAPCSGEGMFRKDSQAVHEWSSDNVAMCQARQRQILSSVFSSLKENGLLFYSTCTYNRLEDEDNVDWICKELGAELVPVNFDLSWGITDSGSGYHFYPHKTRGEGFFLAVLRKSVPSLPVHFKSGKFSLKHIKSPEAINSWLQNPESFDFYMREEKIVAIQSCHGPLLEWLQQNVKVVQSGVAVCSVKGKDLLPSPALALSISLNKKGFSVVDVDWGTAMSFLRRETFNLPDSPKGWLLITFRDFPLGWVKNIGNRINNAYPAEWHVRIPADKSLYTPLF